MSNNTLKLAWTSPPNASNKQLYQVECSPSLNGTWTLLTNAGTLNYEPTRTSWTSPNPLTNAVSWFFRIRLRTF